MREKLIQQVTDSIFEVMETMFYMTLEADARPVSNVLDLFDTKKINICRISFSGNYSGAFSLAVESDLLEMMTNNFMGEDLDSLPDEATDGTLKEALNMIAGNTLTKIDKHFYMGLGIPERIKVSDIDPDGTSLAFKTADGPMAAIVSLNGSNGS